MTRHPDEAVNRDATLLAMLDWCDGELTFHDGATIRRSERFWLLDVPLRRGEVDPFRDGFSTMEGALEALHEWRERRAAKNGSRHV